MHLTLWDKKDTRLYVNGAQFLRSPFIKLQNNQPVVVQAEPAEKALIMNSFPELFSGAPITESVFRSFGTRSRSGGRRAAPDNGSYGFTLKSLDDYVNNAATIDVSACQFKASTLKHLYVLIDTREPSDIYDLFCSGPIREVSRATLPVGDILIGCHRTGAKVVIERKTVADFSSSIQNSHAHDQAERLYDMQQDEIEAGNDVKVVWLVEVGANRQGMYSALPQVKQMSGMVGYLTGVLDQYLYECYSKEHLVYQSLKLMQNHIDRELINKVNSTNGNRGLADRRRALVKTDFTNHGVNRSEQTLEQLLASLPNINARVAKNLAATGLSMAHIANLTIESLCLIEGIGEKSAIKIHNMFNASNW